MSSGYAEDEKILKTVEIVRGTHAPYFSCDSDAGASGDVLPERWPNVDIGYDCQHGQVFKASHNSAISSLNVRLPWMEPLWWENGY